MDALRRNLDALVGNVQATDKTYYERFAEWLCAEYARDRTVWARVVAHVWPRCEAHGEPQVRWVVLHVLAHVLAAGEPADTCAACWPLVESAHAHESTLLREEALHVLTAVAQRASLAHAWLASRRAPRLVDAVAARAADCSMNVADAAQQLLCALLLDGTHSDEAREWLRARVGAVEGGEQCVWPVQVLVRAWSTPALRDIVRRDGLLGRWSVWVRTAPSRHTAHWLSELAGTVGVVDVAELVRAEALVPMVRAQLGEAGTRRRALELLGALGRSVPALGIADADAVAQCTARSLLDTLVQHAHSRVPDAPVLQALAAWMHTRAAGESARDGGAGWCGVVEACVRGAETRATVLSRAVAVAAAYVAAPHATAAQRTALVCMLMAQPAQRPCGDETPFLRTMHTCARVWECNEVRAAFADDDAASTALWSALHPHLFSPSPAVREAVLTLLARMVHASCGALGAGSEGVLSAAVARTSDGDAPVAAAAWDVTAASVAYATSLRALTGSGAVLAPRMLEAAGDSTRDAVQQAAVRCVHACVCSAAAQQAWFADDARARAVARVLQRVCAHFEWDTVLLACDALCAVWRHWPAAWSAACGDTLHALLHNANRVVRAHTSSALLEHAAAAGEGDAFARTLDRAALERVRAEAEDARAVYVSDGDFTIKPSMALGCH